MKFINLLTYIRLFDHHFFAPKVSKDMNSELYEFFS